MIIVPSTTLDQAMAMFRYREEATRRRLPSDPDWQRVMSESLAPALAGERGETDQEQCAYQAIRLALWESGQIQAPWTKAFLPIPAVATQPQLEPAPQPAPLPQIPVVWYRRWGRTLLDWYRAILKRINDLL